MSDRYSGNYPKAWSQREIALYETLGREPAKTSNGLWVSDVERESRELVDWSLAELFALAQNELFTQHQPGSEEFYRVLRNKATVEDLDAIKWSEEELYDWLLYERKPEKSPNGYFLNDPERWVKDAAKWDDAELQDLGCGYFGEPSRNQLYILDEACERFGLPIGITWNAYCAYIQTGERPAVTADGVLIEDRRRKGKSADAYSEAELEAWVAQEIELPETQYPALLKRAIAFYGAGRYWNLEQLRGFVLDNEIPEIDYSQYTDEQLQLLIEEDGDAAAETEWHRRQPDPEPEPVVAEEPEETEPEPEPVELPAITEDDDEPCLEEETCEPDIPECAVDDVQIAEPVWPELCWTDLVPEGTALHQALVAPTAAEVMQDGLPRTLLSASKWSLEELVAWARDEVAPGMNTTERTLITALRGHCGAFVQNWTDDAVKAFIARQELPEGLERGLLVEDAERERKHPGDWTDEELKAWGLGQIKTAVDPDQIVLTCRVRFKLPSKLTDDEVKVFLQTGTVPNKQIPPIKAGEVASPEQLKAWLMGHLAVEESEHARLYQHARLNYGIDPRWTDAHIVSFIRNDKQPTQLEDGTFVDNRLRDLDNWTDWSWNELRALAREQIEARFAIEEALDRVRALILVQFGLDPKQWSDVEVLDYLVSNAKPKIVEDGVYLNDPTRPQKSPVEWRRAELKAWLRGDITATELAPNEALWHEVYVRFEIPVVWYHEDVRSYVLHGTQVPSTPSGIYVRDRHRDARPAKHWTRREIKAWCRGLLLPGINAPEKDLIKQACVLFGVSSQLDNTSIKRRIADITEESMTMTVKFVTDDLESYAKGRKEAGVDAKAAAPYQNLLDRCITRVLRLEGEDFVQGWTELLKFFYQHSKGICSAKQVYVGVGSMVITPKGLRNFQNMTSVLMATCDPTARDKACNLIEWSTALKEVTDEGSRQRLLAYYGK